MSMDIHPNAALISSPLAPLCRPGRYGAGGSTSPIVTRTTFSTGMICPVSPEYVGTPRVTRLQGWYWCTVF